MRTPVRMANLLCLGAALLIGASFLTPLWSLTAQAVQYKMDFPQGLKVYLYLWKIAGEMYELNLMNKWIGAHFPERALEMILFPILFGGVALACVACLFLSRWKKRALMAALLGLLLLTLVGLVSLQGRLYAFGHVRDANPPIVVPDFTVPILGTMQLWNWTISTAFGVGAYILALAALLLALAYVVTAREARNERTWS
ncbi:MAG: hypothetical protein HYY96_15790 [Candidatus Tectomicrobia bacterium]|nr:hypothetical protein [Candidatus Tectomicrobia bacterium]